MRQLPPEEFVQGLTSLRSLTGSHFVTVREVEAPTGLAPYAAALLFGERRTGPTPLSLSRGEPSAVTGTPPPAETDCDSAHGEAAAEGASAYLVILYDPDTQPGWEGTFRLVLDARAPIEPEQVNDPCMGEVAWLWLHEALSAASADYHAAAGTTTRVQAESYGGMSRFGQRNHVEIRASWTPSSTDLLPHAQAIVQLVRVAAGRETEHQG